jgi:hypothetical protein
MPFSNPNSPVTVTNAATLVFSGNDNIPPGAMGTAVAITNTGAVTCYIGGSTVSATSGTPLVSGDTFLADRLGPGDDIYAITASSTTTVAVTYQE